MIATLRGRLAVKEPTRIVLDVNGIGFEVKVPLSTSSRLPEPGNEVMVLIEMEFTKAGVEFFGFLNKKEQEVFRLITSVKGVGPRAGLNLLSRFEPDEVLKAIRNKDGDFLRSVPGIGEKKAAEILKRFDMVQREEPERAQRISEMGDQLRGDAIAALVSLGLSKKEARERLELVKLESDMSLQELLRKALSQPR